ncbi:hypothetical protein C8R44DRAFT_984853 [Mycena epipterygia]|nr:hypothetical protein C8R44DRAFT_984853 [Mycena epipterygia]
MSTLDKERGRITAIDSQIVQLKSERTPLQERLEAYRYPVLTLPNEIVSECFVHLLPAYPLRPPSHGLRSPTMLGHICRKWRNIAFSTPALWRALSVTMDQPSLSKQLHLLETWLKRSGSCPLSISLADDTDDGEVGLMDINKFLQTIFVHRARLEYLELFVPLGDSNIHLIQQQLPLLRSLGISLQRFDVEQETPVFNAAPALHTLTLHDTLLPATATLPWSQLTRFTCQLAHARCVHLLAQTPALVHCSLALDAVVHGLAEIVLPHLESLTATLQRGGSFGAGFVHADGLLGKLTLPALRRLEITQDLLGDDPLQKLGAFIARSGCSLAELRVLAPGRTRGEYHVAFPTILTILFTSASEAGDDESDSEDSDDELYIW